MRTASEKQAIYIYNLSYALYKLRGCNNFKTIVSLEDAMKLSADIASDIIIELKAKVHEEEYKQYIEPYIRAFAIKVKLIPLSIPDYKKVDRVKPIDNLLYVYTTDGAEYTLDGANKFVLGSKVSTIRVVYSNLVSAINHDLGVRIITRNDVCVLTLEDTKRDKAILESIKLINAVLNITDGLLFKDHKGNFSPDYVGIVTKFVEMRDSKVAEKLRAVLSNSIEAQFFCSILTASQQHFNNISLVLNK